MVDNNTVFSRKDKQYRSPKTKVVPVRTQGLLCDGFSKGETYTTEMEEGNDNW